MPTDVHAYAAGGGRVSPAEAGSWELSVPADEATTYRLAQLDDYAHLNSRADFLHCPPARLQVRARVSDPAPPGTWGFGFWNDPFGAGLAVRGSGRRLPALPQAAWFFFASPPNHLTLHDAGPGHGFLAATFRSRWIPLPALALGAPLVPGLLLPPTARLLRRLARRFIEEDGLRLTVDPTDRHDYELEWLPDRVSFRVDDATVFETAVSPRGPLGLVLWVDNQYAAFPPDGRLRVGCLPAAEPVRLELTHVRLQHPPAAP